MKTVRWFVFNGFFSAIAYCWIVLGNSNAGTFLVVMAWIMAITSFVGISDKVIEERIKSGETKLGVPLIVDFAFDLCFTVVFIAGGAPAAAVAYLFHTVMLQAHHKALKKKIDECKAS